MINAVSLLYVLLLVGKGFQNSPVSLCDRGNIVVEAINEDFLLFIFQGSQSPDQTPGRVGQHYTHPGVGVLADGLHGQINAKGTAHPKAGPGTVLFVVTAVLPDDGVRTAHFPKGLRFSADQGF